MNLGTQKKDADGKEVWVHFSRLGVRASVLNDLSPAATFVAHNYNHPIFAEVFIREASRILNNIESKYRWMYETKHSDGRKGVINFVVWSDVFVCPNCSCEIVFYDAAFDQKKMSVKRRFSCPHCKTNLTKRKMDRLFFTKYDPFLGKSIKTTKRVPVLIYYSIDSMKFEKRPDKNDIGLINRINEEDISVKIPIQRMVNGRESRRNDPIGMTHVHHYFTRRSLVILSEVFQQILESNDNVRHWLLFTYEQSIMALSKWARYVPTHYSQVNQGLSGTLYIGSQIVEASLEYVVGNKINRLYKFLKKYKLSGLSTVGSTESATNIGLKENSVDYIFLDPPFGANIDYSELSFIWESWLKVWTNNKLEAVQNEVQNKGINDYYHLMKKSFKKAYRMLKPGHWMTVEFSNTKASIWNIIQSAISDVGFIVANVSALDKQQGSFKAVTTTTAVKQDLIISAYKPNGGFKERFNKQAETEQGVWDFVRTHLSYLPIVKTSDDVLQHIPERDPRILYDQVISYYVRNGFMVPLSSQEFQAGLHQRFAERDGMIFLPQEVAEYDKAKLRLGNKIQYALFVSDESSAIDWLHRFLKEKPQTYQEIQPSFMGEAQRSWKKNEKPIELQTLLEQNFIRYDSKGPVPPQIHSYLSSNWKEYRNLEKDDPDLKVKAKDRWYVPDPNQAGDVEKLRERSLLREFEMYKEGKKKLKLFRLEALRAGFKKVYVENDYKTIMEIADRLPHNALEEDPKLLMWYDLAKTRMEG